MNNKLSLFDDTMGLFVECITIAGGVVHDSDAQIAHFTLMARAFNDLRAAYRLLIEGYYAQMFPLLRSSYECSSRMHLFTIKPSFATKWLSGKEIPDRDIRKEFVEENIWKETYSSLSGYTHMNFKTMSLHSYDTSLDEVKVFAFGGHQNERALKILSSSLIGNATFALAISSKPYYSLMSDDWAKRFGTLLVALAKLTQDPVGTSS